MPSTTASCRRFRGPGFTTKWFHNAFSNTELIDALEAEPVDRDCGRDRRDAARPDHRGGHDRPQAAAPRARDALVLLPLVIPYIVLAVGLLILLNWLGLERSLWAVLLGHIAVSVPYCLLIILPRLRTLDQAIVDAARDLGAGPWTAFRRVTLPLIIPALFSSR